MSKPTDTSNLRQKPTYSQLINEVETDYKLKLPDRKAKFTRDSPYLAFLDREIYTDMAEQQEREAKNRLVQNIIRNQSSKNRDTFKENLLQSSVSSENDSMLYQEDLLPEPSEGTLDEQYEMLGLYEAMQKERQSKIANLVRFNLASEEDPEQTRNFASQLAQQSQSASSS